MNNLLKTFESLIEIPSVTNSKAEKEIIIFTEEKLKNIVSENENLSWVDILIDKIENTEENWKYHWWILCHIKIGKEKETVWLLGHLDVVPVSKNWEKEPFKLTEDENKFYWRWTCDMKSWDSIMIEILRESLEKKPNKNITLLFTSWEECGIPNWLTEIIKSKKIWWLDFVIALEPTWWKINTGVFWYLDWEFHFKWKTCHSSKPSLWENAIHKMWPFLNYLNNPDCIKWITYFNEKLEEALSATIVKWWLASNSIPDEVILQTNYRYSPYSDWKNAEELMIKLAKKYWADSFNIIEHDPSSKIVRSDNLHLLEFIEKTKLWINLLNIVPFWTDITQTSDLWIPSINFWPWSINQAHTDDEFLLKKSFEDTYKQFIYYIFN